MFVMFDFFLNHTLLLEDICVRVSVIANQFRISKEVGLTVTFRTAASTEYFRLSPSNTGICVDASILQVIQAYLRCPLDQFGLFTIQNG